MICGDCKKYMKCPNAGTVFTECVYEEQYWESFRTEAAKDILCAVLSGGITSGMVGIVPEKENLVKVSTELADELIKQLKEKEESK